MELRPLANERDHEEALAEIRRLWDAKPGSPAASKLEILAMLVNHYERMREPLPSLNPIDAIKFRMEQQGLTRKDLLPIFGTTARVSEVLGGKRPLTLEMIRKLHAVYDIPLESLIQRPTRKAKTKRRRAA